MGVQGVGDVHLEEGSVGNKRDVQGGVASRLRQRVNGEAAGSRQEEGAAPANHKGTAISKR